MARKMHFALQDIGNDSPKISEARKESISTIYQPQNKLTSLEDCQESPLSRINSDSGCAILTLLNFEPDGSWRISAVPVQCLNHINLVSSINMDGLQLLFRPPLNRLKIDQCKGPGGSPPPYYSVKSLTRSNFSGSNVRRRCQNKIANKASKLNEIPGNSCSRSSLVCSSPGLFTESPAEVNSSDKLTSNAKEDKSLKKNSRKRIRKKVKQSKKQSSDSSGSTEREVLTEDYACVSLASETCGNNDVDKEVGLMLYTTPPEFSSCDDILVKDDCERNEMNDDKSVTEAPKSCNSCIDQEAMSKATAPIVQNSSSKCAFDNSRDFAVIDRETKDVQDVANCHLNDIQDSLVLDSVSVGSKSDESTNSDIGKRSNKASSRISSTSQNLINGVRSNDEHNEGIRHGGQNCISNDKRVKQMRTMSKSSSFNKFGGVGTLHGRAGKENSHSVWQKVQKNGNEECGSDLKKANTTSSQFVSSAEKDPSVMKNCSPASKIVVSKTENKKQLKNKVGRKSKGKMEPVSKKGHCNYNVKVSAPQNDMPHVSGFDSDINCQMSGFQINGAEQVISEVEELDQVGNTKNENIGNQDSSLVMPDGNANEWSMSEEQSPVSDNLLLGEEVGQTEKEVSSADYNAQNHSSGSTLWKWIPIVKKDTGLAKSESSSSSPEYSDAPTSKSFDLESSVEPIVTSVSENQVSSLNANRACTDQIYDKVSCLVEGEDHKLVSPVACTLAEQRDKHVVANHMIYECEHEDTLENDSYRIAQAVNDARRAQLACEAVHMATGGPVAEFERLLHFCSPVICESPNSVGCLTCSQDHAGGCVSLCQHETPDISLGSLWQWYEKHGSYGLEIRAEDYENPKSQGGVGHFPFRAYFVPSLSAVQLFKNHENQYVSSTDKFPNCTGSEVCETIDVSENSSTSSQHSIFSVLFPQPRNQDSSIQTTRKSVSTNDASDSSVNSTRSSDLELLFEYFELEQPQQRRPLYEKIQELARGDIPLHSKTYRDPTILDSINLRDLHPRSWYSVAWYPIYRIPEGNFRAAFLTYHSLGHLVRRSTYSDSPTVGSYIVSPAVGLQSYNAQGECWFQLKDSALSAETLGLNPSLLLKERLRTLEETASLMARAVVSKGNHICTNRHPDYEFFLSRRRY